jgi:hypothetical protein
MSGTVGFNTKYPLWLAVAGFVRPETFVTVTSVDDV